MQGKTHLAVGEATALAILQPQTMPDLFVGAGVAMIGGVICDIDVGTSESHEKADKVIAFSVFMIGALAVIEWIWHIGIIDRLMEDSNLTKSIRAARFRIAQNPRIASENQTLSKVPENRLQRKSDNFGMSSRVFSALLRSNEGKLPDFDGGGQKSLVPDAFANFPGTHGEAAIVTICFLMKFRC